MSMYGSRGYKGFHDYLHYADWKRKADREEALNIEDEVEERRRLQAMADEAARQTEEHDWRHDALEAAE